MKNERWCKQQAHMYTTVYTFIKDEISKNKIITGNPIRVQIRGEKTLSRWLNPQAFPKIPYDLILYHFGPRSEVFYWIWDNWSGVLWESLFLQLLWMPSKRPKLWKGWGLPGRPELQLVCVVPVAPGCSVNKVCFLSVHASCLQPPS